MRFPRLPPLKFRKPTLRETVIFLAGLSVGVIGTLVYNPKATYERYEFQPLGVFEMTKYYTPDQKDFSIWSSHKRQMGSKEACRIPMSKRGFYEATVCEGSGIAYKNNKELLCEHDKLSYKGLEHSKCTINTSNSLGVVSNGDELRAGESIAVDTSIIPKGSLVEIVFLNQDGTQCRTPECKAARGIYPADDVGSGVKKKKIDFYVGRGADDPNTPAARYFTRLPDYAKVSIIPAENLSPERKLKILEERRPLMYHIK